VKNICTQKERERGEREGERERRGEDVTVSQKTAK